jgi:hypothetical protein
MKIAGMLRSKARYTSCNLVNLVAESEAAKAETRVAGLSASAPN